MKNLEDMMRNAPKPEVRVDAFRRRLRNKLLDAHPARARAPFSYKAALAGTSMMSVLLAGILVLFVARPSDPVQLHYAFLPESEARSSVQAEEEGSAAAPLASDERLIRLWAEERFKAQPVKIQPLQDTETYTVRRFKLDNGRFVQIHTRLPDPGNMRRVSY